MLSSEILKLLFENEKMTFREIWESMGCGRTACNKTLNQLITAGFVLADPNWHNGKKRFFRITEQGSNHYRDEIVSDLNSKFSLLETVLDKLLSPRELWQIHRNAGFHPTLEEMQSGHITAMRIKEMSKHKEKVLAPMNSLVFKIVKDLLKADPMINASEDLSNVVVIFKDGKPCLSSTVGSER